MTDISVVILTGNEELHIERCLDRLMDLEPSQVFVIDCYSTDRTKEIAESHKLSSLGTQVHVIQRKWPGLYAKQLNWALDNCPISSTWVLRLDADEYLYPETCREVRDLLPGLSAEITSLSLPRARVFCGRKIRFGGAATAHVPMVRFFRYKIGRCEDRAMDEHIITSCGIDYRLKGEFVDDNLNTMEWWREKHRGYARREALDALAFGRGELHFKKSKELYYRQIPFLRALLYFCIRYILLGGVLDGYAGWMWHFWQGLWYRWLVDKTIIKMRRQTEGS